MPKLNEEQISEIEALRSRLAEAEGKLAEAQELIRAIQSGDVDAVVVSGPHGDQVFTLKGAEYAYRALVEAMNEGAATLSRTDGTVLYCNGHISELLGISIEQIIGNPVTNLVTSDTRMVFDAVLARAHSGEPGKAEVEFLSRESKSIPVYVSMREMKGVEPPALCMVVTDLRERKKRDEMIAAGRLATSILDSAAEAIAVCDESGIIIRTNGAMEELCGCSPLFRPFDAAMPLELISGPFSVREALTGETLRTREAQFLRPDGQFRTLLLTAAPIKAAAGIVGCVLTMTDITARKRVQEALRASDARYRELFDSMDEGFCVVEMIFDAQGKPVDYRFLEANAAFERQTGMHGAVGKRMLEFAPEHEEHWFSTYGKIALTGEPAHFVNEAKALNRYYDVHAYRVGEPEQGRVAIVFNDFSERMKANEVLKRQAEMLRLSFDAILVWQLDKGIESWNHGAEQLYGYSESEALGRISHELLKTKHSVPVDEFVAKLYASGSWEGELSHTTKDGRVVFVYSRHQLIVGSDGVTRILETNRDVTESKQTAAALIRAEKLATVGRMASTIAHEINNPLEAIGNSIYLAMTDQEISPTAKSYLEVAMQELDRVTHIARQTLAFHRENTKPQLVDLRETVEGVLKIFETRMKARGIIFERRFSEVGRVRVFGSEIRQVISNLLSNSMDAVTGTGRIICGISPAASGNGVRKLRLTIADTGCGIKPEQLAVIFEPFFTTKEMYGTGLGLWVSKQIAEKHGAKIRAHSKPGKGSAFSITFPVAEEV